MRKAKLSIMELFIPSCGSKLPHDVIYFQPKGVSLAFPVGKLCWQWIPSVFIWEMFLFHPHLWKIMGINYWLTFFFFHHFGYVILCLLDFLVAINCIVVSLNCFSLYAFKTFLFALVFSSLTMWYLSMTMFVFFLFWVHCSSWGIFKLMVFIKFRKFGPLLCTQIFASVSISRVNINTDYSNNNHTILQDGRLCPGTRPKPTLRQE